MLYSLTYISKAHRLMKAGELSGLLLQSRAHNTLAHITGMLIYVHSQTAANPEGRFMQVIEGEHDQVKTLFAAIQKDSRHHDVMVLSEETIKNRSFKHWTMGFKTLHAADGVHLPEYLDLGDYHTIDKHLSGINKPVNYLKSFYQINLELHY